MNIKFIKNKKFWIYAGLGLGVLLVGYFIFGPKSEKVSYTTEVVKRGNLIQTVSATGAVESANEISLNFQSPGKLTYLAVKEGLEVKAGQLLATIDSGSINALVKQYEANLASARANLLKVESGASQEDIQLTQEQLTKSLNDYDSLVRDSEIQVKILREKMVDNLNNAVFTIQTNLDAIYNDLINTQTTSGLIFSDSNLNNKNTSQYYLLKDDFASLRAQIEAVKGGNSDQEKIIIVADTVRAYLGRMGEFLDSSYYLADKIIVNTSYTQTRKDSIKSNIGAQQTANNASLVSLQASKSNLVNGANSYETQIQSASNSVAIMRAQLNLKQANPRDFDIASAKAQVAQAQAALDKARADASNYIIKAPIDGKITQVNYSLGETTAGTNPVIKLLGVERYEIKVDVPESNITKIKIADKATIELDAFGGDRLFRGTVVFIDPAQTIIRDVTYYKTTISFDADSWNEEIKPGMTANLTIVSQEKEAVLYIPQRAVKVREALLGEVPEKFVQVLVDNQPQDKTIVVGLRGDNGLVEVLSGLEEGEQVITFIKDDSKK